mgnify:CR=1 FL=1
MTPSSDNEIEHRILSLAAHLEDGDPSAAALEAARQRGWIDPAGTPTQDGRRLAAALAEQAGTRTVFRNV